MPSPIPLRDPGHRPRAWRLATDAAEIYEIPNLLPRNLCAELIAVIQAEASRATTMAGITHRRTAHVCRLPDVAPDLAAVVDRRFAALIGADPLWGDPLQGQRYRPGELYTAHIDSIPPEDPAFAEHLARHGQRTWTVMVYLNTVEEGGQTLFHRIGRRYDPIPGFGLAWNNLLPDGTPNPATLHGSLRVERGVKVIATKWFRTQPRPS